MNRLRHFFAIFISIFVLSTLAVPAYAYSLKLLKNYKPTVAGFENRLSLNNILTLTSLSAGQGEQLLLKAGYEVDSESGGLTRMDHYALGAQERLYSFFFPKNKNAKGFKYMIIFTQPEMRIISAAFRAGGYQEIRVVPRKGARWTKIYTKKGYPTYSISLLLFSDMNPRAEQYLYNDYMYCLICEKQ